MNGHLWHTNRDEDCEKCFFVYQVTFGIEWIKELYSMSYQNTTFVQSPLFLVTDGAGFTGSNLCEAILNFDYRVRCLEDLSTKTLSTLY